jgi:predicted ATPase
VAAAEADYHHARTTLAEERGRAEKAARDHRHAVAAATIVQEVAADVQTRAHRHIAGIVTRCLAIFPRPYRFKIHFLRRRGKTWARLAFARGGREFDPTGGAGGGVLDVAAFALRLACLMVRRPRRRRLLVLDEPFKHLSAEYRPAVRDLVLTLASELGVQFIIVTHSTDFTVGKVVRLGRGGRRK